MNASSQTQHSLTILGVHVHNLSKSQVLAALSDYAVAGAPHHVVTLNPEYLVQAHASPEFKAVLNRADLALADGVGLVWAARLMGQRLVARIPGVDLVDWLADLAAGSGYSMFLLGARPGVAEAAAAGLAQRYPGLVIAGAYAGSSRPADETAVIERITAVRPHFLLVAYGAPEQDIWIRRNLQQLGVPVAIGVGGAFDYLSGRVARAPRWIRAVGLEWLFRLIREPWRWRRMLRLPRFVWLVLLQRLQKNAPGAR